VRLRSKKRKITNKILVAVMQITILMLIQNKKLISRMIISKETIMTMKTTMTRFMKKKNPSKRKLKIKTALPVL